MSTLGELSIEGLRALIDELVEQKLLELLGDPDEGLTARAEVRQRLLKSLSQSHSPAKAVPAHEVARHLGLDW
jgi:hypothetical protein